MIQPEKYTCYIAGQPAGSGEPLKVYHPYNRELVGEVPTVGRAEIDLAIQTALKAGKPLTRFERSEILDRARHIFDARKEEFAQRITAESGLCLRESRYELGRASDVFRFASIEALKDDGQIFSCDISPTGKARKIFTLREPLTLATAITPFNHPLNQVAHKLAPAIAAGTPIILKPSEKTPLTAIRCAEVLYEAGLPGWMLSVVLGPMDVVAKTLVQDERIELVSFTGSVSIGKEISKTAGYKKLVLELGGNAPLIVFEDADLDKAVFLAAEGSYRNSGQRCTAVKRILVQESIREEFTRRFVEKSKEYVAGDPFDEATRVGTVIDEPAAMRLERVVKDAVSQGAKVLLGGNRRGALLEPTVITDVPRTAEMVVCESFGPLAPIMGFSDLEDVIQLANSTAFGLSTGVVTNRMDYALEVIRRVRTGTVNINEVPGYRIESSPFGGVKDSGLGIKEGVIEAMKCMSTVKTFSLPW